MDSQLGSARRRPSKRVSNNSNKPLGPAAARPINPVQARREFFLVEQSGRSIPSGQAAAALQSLQSMISGLGLFSKQHLTASKALAHTFDQRLAAI